MIRYVYVGACAAVSLALVFPNLQYMLLFALVCGWCAAHYRSEVNSADISNTEVPMLSLAGKYMAMAFPALLVVAGLTLRLEGLTE